MTKKWRRYCRGRILFAAKFRASPRAAPGLKSRGLNSFESPRLKKHLLLIGYRGTGKTPVATLLAQELNCPVVDTDRLIAEREGKSIAVIFRDHGEPYFRDRETEALQLALQSPPQFISTGGGIVLREANRDLLRQGQVIWLRASLDT